MNAYLGVGGFEQSTAGRGSGARERRIVSAVTGEGNEDGPIGIRVVLVGPTHPGNIGAAARAMRTMGLRDLHLVRPRVFPSSEATDRAAGADDVLESARVVSSLDQALSDCHFAVGASARERAVNWPMLDPREAGRRLVAESTRGRVAMVFGRESTGLSNDELDRCQALVRIPTCDDFRSLNLAAAVQVLAYETQMARRRSVALGGSGPAPGPMPATAAQLRGLHDHLETVLHDIDFLKGKPPDRLMRKLVRLGARARPSAEDVNILRGILTAVQHLRRGPRG